MKTKAQAAYDSFYERNIRFLGFGEPHIPSIDERVMYAFLEGFKAGQEDHNMDFELPEGSHLAAIELEEELE